MKLMIVIVHDTDSDAVLQALLGKGFRVTRVASTGGFLRRGNVTLLIGVENGQVDNVLEILRQNTQPVEQQLHRATVFVVDMPYFEQI
jgi:uncharacterized protein YaaQ